MENSHFKCYNGKDTYGLKLLRKQGIKTGLITAHDSKVLQNMAHIIPRMDHISAGHYNKIDVLKQWLKQDADNSAKFLHGGKFDTVRNMYGFAARNVMDPVINSIKKYHETGKDSYVVLHVEAPNKSGNLKTFRKNQKNQYNEYKSMFTKLGMKHFPLHILGFMYQDTEGEDKRHLVTA